MHFTIERLQDVLFFKVNGITRFVWMPRRGNASTFTYLDGILVIGLFGWCVVFAPFKR